MARCVEVCDMQNAETTLAIIREQSMTLITGEPCAAKVACTVRGEAHGKGPQGTSPGAYPTGGCVGVVGQVGEMDMVPGAGTG